MAFKIVRMFANGETRIINTGLTLSQAKCHCDNPEVNSQTAESQAAKYLTAIKGPWFDTYDSEGNSCDNCECCHCELGGES